MEAMVMPSVASVARAAGRRETPLAAVIAVLFALLITVCLLSVAVGAVAVPVRSIVVAMFGGRALSGSEAVILLHIRLPRVAAAALVGAALSVAGLLFQGLFRNPMADPYVIGSSGGAALGASFGIFLLPRFSVLGFSATSLLAFAGAMVSIAIVYWIARSNGRTPVITLLLAGFAISTMLSYTSYFLELLDQSFGLGARMLGPWLHGTIDVPRWPQLGIAATMIALAGLACIPLGRSLNTLALGDEYAHQLGLRVERIRLEIIIVGSLLTAAAVSLGGLIGFVGLVVPHLMRLLMGPDNLRLLPATAIGGAIFLVCSDTLARSILSPAEVPVGVLMAFVGGPFFLYLLRRSRKDYSL